MTLTPKRKQAAGLVLAGAVGYFTGETLPPEVMGELVAALVGLF